MKLKIKPNGIHFLEVELPDTAGNLKRTRVSFDTRDKAEAEHQLRLWKLGTHPKHPNQGREIAPKGRGDSTGKAKERSTGLTIAKLLDICHSHPDIWGKVASQATVRSNIKLLNELVGDMHPADLTYGKLEALRDDMLAEGHAMASVKRKLLMLSKALRMAASRLTQEDGITTLIAARPEFPPMNSNNKRDRVLDAQEELVVFACIDARMVKEPARQWWRFRWFIRTLLDTGFRRGEALQLGPQSVNTIGAIDPATGQRIERTVFSLTRYSTKNDKPREVPATDVLIDMVPALNAQAVNGRWFPIGSSAWYMWDNIRQDCKAQGVNIDDVGLHTLRHTCLTRLARSGTLDLLRLSIWAGHSDVSITASRYTHMMTQDLLGGLQALQSNPSADSSNPAYYGIPN